MNQHIKQTRYWHALDDEKIQCDLCPRQCQLKAGQQGLCFVRENKNSSIVLNTYGRSSGFCIDPIEKKPLNHFYPGSAILSFGTAGCNLSCKFCQNWDISKSRQQHRLADEASPETIAKAASHYQCQSVAYTYNDPVIFHEYAIDVAQACAAENIKSVAVTAGYINAPAREEFFAHMDATNIDLKAFSEDFYYKLTGGHLQPVLDTIDYVANETHCWLEITTLLIPGKNDSEHELHALSQWLYEHTGAETPLHFTAFHPDWKMRDIAPTTTSSLLRARKIARETGLKHVYTGNVHDLDSGSSYCSGCGERLIARDWYTLSQWQLDENACCIRCGHRLAGRFSALPGDWGQKRLPIRLDAFQ